MALFLRKFALLVGIQAGKDIEILPGPNDSEKSKRSVQNLAFPKCFRPRRALEEQSHFIARNCLEFRKVIVSTLSSNTKRHLAEGTNPVGIATIIGPTNLVAADPIVYNFLFVSQIAKVSTNHWSKLVLIAPSLGGWSPDCYRRQERCEDECCCKFCEKVSHL
jgi:hypothetical protein